MIDTDIKTTVVPVLGFVAYSGSGKTTLLAHLIPELKSRGLRIGVIKHAHHNFDIDKPGKDSYVLRQAGAQQTLVASKNRWALMVETPDKNSDPSLPELIGQLDQNQLDLIMVEGFKHAHFPKLEINRAELNKPLLCHQDPDIIAVITDRPSDIAGDTTVLDINNHEQIVQYIIKFIGNAND